MGVWILFDEVREGGHDHVYERMLGSAGQERVGYVHALGLGENVRVGEVLVADDALMLLSHPFLQGSQTLEINVYVESAQVVQDEISPDLNLHDFLFVIVEHLQVEAVVPLLHHLTDVVRCPEPVLKVRILLDPRFDPGHKLFRHLIRVPHLVNHVRNRHLDGVVFPGSVCIGIAVAEVTLDILVGNVVVVIHVPNVIPDIPIGSIIVNVVNDVVDVHISNVTVDIYVPNIGVVLGGAVIQHNFSAPGVAAMVTA